MQTTLTSRANPRERGESHFQICHIVIFKMPIFNTQKNYKAGKEIRMYGPHTGEKANTRNSLGGNPDIRYKESESSDFFT